MPRHQSILINEEANGINLSISATHAETGALSYTEALVISTVDCYVTKGANPVATANHQFLPANMPLGIHGWKLGEQLSFLAASGTGTVHIKPGA